MKRFLAALFVGLLIVGGLVWLRSGKHRAEAAKAPDTSVPVATAQASTMADVPLTVDGIGTVQALNTVNIRAMVDGPLIEIRFREGQDVRTRATCWPHRRAHLPGGARPGRGQEGAGRGDAGQRAARPDALRQAGEDPIHHRAQQADTQRSTVAQTRRWCARTRRRSTPRAPTSATRPVNGPGGRPHRHTPGRCRQSGAQHGRHTADRGDHAAADLGRVHPAAADACPRWSTRCRRAGRPAGRRCWRCRRILAIATAPPPVLDRVAVLAVLDNQVDQNTGTIKLKADLPEPRVAAVAGGVRQRPSDAAGGPRCGHRYRRPPSNEVRKALSCSHSAPTIWHTAIR